MTKYNSKLGWILIGLGILLYLGLIWYLFSIQGLLVTIVIVAVLGLIFTGLSCIDVTGNGSRWKD